MLGTGKLRKDGSEKMKPAAILEYNRRKQGVDISDALASYHSPLRKSFRWYHKVVSELLLNTAVVNARVLFDKLTQSSQSMKYFREAALMSLLGLDKARSPPRDLRRKRRHTLTESERVGGRNRRVRGRCQDCYAKAASIRGRLTAQVAVIRVNTRCQECEKWL